MRKAKGGEVLTVIVDGAIHHYDWHTKKTMCDVKPSAERMERLRYRMARWLQYAPDRCQPCFE